MTSMTRKHFQAIADAIRGCVYLDESEITAMREDGIDAVTAQRENIAFAIADALRQFNPAFDRERFLKACGVDA